MNTLLQNLKTIFKANSSILEYFQSRNIEIGRDVIDQLVSYNKFPFIIIDRAREGVGEEFTPTDVGRFSSTSGKQKLRNRIFHVSIYFAVRLRSKESALLGDEGLLEIYNTIMDVIFDNPTVNGRVEKLNESIQVNEAEIYQGETFLGLGREIILTYVTTDEYT